MNFTHKELVEIGHKWLVRFGCGFAFKEFRTMCSETPDVIGWKWSESILIECKTSRSDYLADRKKHFRIDPDGGLGAYRFYLCPKGVIKINDLPYNWGLIYVNEKGKAKIRHNPYNKDHPDANTWEGGFLARNFTGERQIMMSALRRLHLRGVINLIYDKQ